MASLVSMRQVQAFRAGARAGPRRVPCLTQRPQRSSVRVRAEMGDDNKPQQKVSVRESFTHFTQRYDFLSTGIGALCVTTWCWMHGQDPITALSITASSTVAALVFNELFFDA